MKYPAGQKLLAVVIALSTATVVRSAPATDVGHLAQAIANIRHAFSPSFSPDGSKIAFVSDESGTPNVWTISSTGSGAPSQVTKFEDPVERAIWSPLGDWLAVELSPGGSGHDQIYVIRPDGKSLRRLTTSDKSDTYLYGWTPDGGQLLVASNSRDPAHLDSYLLDVATAQLRPIGKQGDGQTSPTDVSSEGRLAVIGRITNYPDSALNLVDLTTAAETPLTEQHEAPAGQDFSSARWGQFSPDRRRIYLTTANGGDLLSFAFVEVDAMGHPGAVHTLAAREDGEADSAALDPTGKQTVLVWDMAGRSALELLDVDSGRVEAAPTVPGEVVSDVVFSKSGTQVAMVVSGAAQPTDVYSFDLETKQYRQITHSRHDNVPLDQLVRPTLLRYRAPDGIELSGWLYRPRNVQGPGPVVCNYHGGPSAQAKPKLDPVTQALVARGISVFDANVRGSTGFGERFEKLDDGILRRNAVQDIKTTADYLVSQGIADRKRIGIMGGSAGGFMVLAGIVEFPDTFAAAADLYGIANYKTWFANAQPYNAAESTVEFGDPVRESRMLDELSPVHRLAGVKTPLLVQHGTNDTEVPIEEARQVVAALRLQKTPVRYRQFANEGHGWQHVDTRVQSTISLVQFFGEYLGRATDTRVHAF